MAESRGVVFHPAIARTFLLVWIASGALIVLAFVMSGEAAPRKYVMAIAASGALAYGIALVAREMFRIRIDDAGIEGADVSGRRMTVAWSDVQGAAKTLGYVKLRVRDSRRTLWLPGDVKEAAELADAIERAAGSEHAAARAFREIAESRKVPG